MAIEHIGERHKINLFWFNQKDPSLNQQMQSPEGKTLKQPYFLGTPNFQGVNKEFGRMQLSQKDPLVQVFSDKLCKTSKNTQFTEHLITAASEYIF